MSAENLPVINLLPEEDPPAQEAIQPLRRRASNRQVIHAFEQSFRPCVGCNACRPVTMYAHIAGDSCRHVPRYDKKFRFGLLYKDAADRTCLDRFIEQVMLNFDRESPGTYPIENAEEVLSCI